MKFALDTNIFTSILDDSDHRVRSFLSNRWNHVQLSAINIAELGATRDPKRRVQLLKVANELWRGDGALKFCPHLLNDSIEWFESGRRSFTVSIASDNGIYVAIRRPELAAAPEVQKELENYISRQREWLQEANDQARARFGEQLEQLPKSEQQKRFKTWSELYRFVEKSAGVEVFVKPLLEDWPVKSPKAIGSPAMFLRKNPFWRLLLVALTLSIWNRVFRKKRYGRRFELGSLDVQQLPYLPLIDAFVTSDPPFRRASMLAREFSPNRPVILSYGHLKALAERHM